MLPAYPLTKRLRAAIAAGLQSCQRPEPVPMAQWADENFWLSPEGSTQEGKWESLPFQRPILNMIGHPDIQQLNFVKSARVGYTQMIRIAVGYFLAHKSRSQIVYQPTDSDAENFMKSHGEPMIRDVPTVRALAPWYGKKHRDSTLSQKRFANGRKLFVLGGGAARNYREKSVDNVYYDELSKFDDDIEGEGSPTFLGDKRFELSIFPKSVRGSTPGIEPDEEGKGCQITVASRQAQCYFRRYVPCPHCGHEQVLKWGGEDCPYGIKWVNDDPSTAAYLCEHCAALIENKHSMAMDEAGVMRCEKTGIYTHDGLEFFTVDGKATDAPVTVSVHIWTAYNPMVMWSSIVDGWMKTKGDRGSLKAFVNTTLGETWKEDRAEKIDEDALYNRREHYPAEIPVDDCILTAAVDVQDDRFEIQFDAWVHGEERFAIAYERLYGDLSRAEIWQTLYKRLTRGFKSADGTIFEAMLVCIDSGGHYTDEVYQFSKRYGRRRFVPIKGHSLPGKPVAKWPRQPNDKGVYLTMIGTDTAKEIVSDRLKIQEPGDGYVHFPVNDEFDQDYFKHYANETWSWKLVKGRRVKVWNAYGRRNEPFDLAVYNLAAVRILLQHAGKVLPQKSRSEPHTMQPDTTPSPTPPPAARSRGVRSKGVRL